jgi:UDP-N-acetylmuramate dehydrogenase
MVTQLDLMQRDISLKNKNWFNTGGAARYYAEPITVDQYQKLFCWAQEYNQPITILGAGANVLIADTGINGLTIKPHTQTIGVTEHIGSAVHVQAGAGCSMDTLIEWCLTHNIIGLEEFSGIPGTVGGSVYINLHYYQFLLEHFLHTARVIDIKTGTLITVPVEWFQFGYDISRLQDKQHILFDATFKLTSTDTLGTMYARGRRIEIMRHRTARYPSKNTCGSFFRNFLPAEVTLESNGKKMIYVAYDLDKIGAKGTLSVGDAIVSYQHANMLVNKGNATTDDIVKLARTLQTMVTDQFGIIPQPECQLLGFDECPLL